MTFEYSSQFKRNLRRLPVAVQEKFYKQAAYLLKDLRHPSLHAKKYDEARNVWQARVDRDVRFYFSVSKDTYFLLNIQRHPK